MHQFPVHTEHTKKSHSLHTTVTIMKSSNGCSSKVLVLQKRFWKQFGPAFTINLITSIFFNLFKSHTCTKPLSTPHTTTSFRYRNKLYKNNDITYIATYLITQYITHQNTQYNPLQGSLLNIFNIYAIFIKTFVSTYLLHIYKLFKCHRVGFSMISQHLANTGQQIIFTHIKSLF